MAAPVVETALGPERLGVGTKPIERRIALETWRSRQKRQKPFDIPGVELCVQP
jgi:hypothetical protein